MGQRTAIRVHTYFRDNRSILEKYSTVAFYDTEEDKSLPWSPSNVLKAVLSDNNYFTVYWNGDYRAEYYGFLPKIDERGLIMIKSRDFLGY
jgi:hypothetical protein